MRQHSETVQTPPDPTVSSHGSDDQKERYRIVTENLSVFFDGKAAIRDVSMAIRTNRVTAIIGPSGCGKSTFLRALNRLHEIQPNARVEGRIMLDGENIMNLDPTLVRRRIGMVFQKPNPFPGMSIFDNVVAGLRFNGIRKRSLLEEVAEEALRRAALWEEVKDRLRAPATSLSGGQQQRLCIARALAIEPEVLLMDEPTSALDPIATAKIEELIYELKRTYTIVIVTHNMQQAARVSDYTAFMYLGELIEFDKTRNIFTNPSKRQTEEYITGRFG
ncbi:MAG: phosphate ABC transporter ATP-binding protein PstB [Bacteroidota bacterium]|nr:phosphate ABC transporter ATP-binding protein PstB [Candidatus Kapabacteria bacterium]MCS7303103.1 phosphate ABC transporter ATP-binding protein PstB [Candidatus Kapabacteria bacterium]MCX7937396.1 phosphate ABC transporter ATP-binding protein PstB [Chlorobiota bacterium]MDW8075676.1 phosphate ABC transporter ATP-binding protein PstB [Bacteroidota bacterium]MDW8272267.1 phosphate ABC transporter ATP-binding protein PstB [Bacteroidota bacterium]